MSLNFVDRYQSTLASSYTSGGTSLSITSAGSLPSGACDLYLIVRSEGANTEEVFHVTNRTGTTLTVVGAQAGTTASDHATTAVIVGGIFPAAVLGKFTVQLAQTVTSGSATSVDFQDIPGSYTTLIIAFSVRTTASVASAGMNMKVNNDGTSGNYSSSQYLFVGGTSVSANTVASSSAGGFCANVTGATATSGFDAIGTIRIQAYAGTTFKKKFLTLQTYSESGSDCAIFEIGGAWLSTSAITRLTFTLDSSDAFLDGSQITIYGEA